MKELIDYLFKIGYDDANSNFIFLKELIETDTFKEDYCMTREEFTNIKLIIYYHIDLAD